MKETSLL